VQMLRSRFYYGSTSGALQMHFKLAIDDMLG